MRGPSVMKKRMIAGPLGSEKKRMIAAELWIRIHPDTDPDPAFQVNPDIQGVNYQKLKEKNIA